MKTKTTSIASSRKSQTPSYTKTNDLNHRNSCSQYPNQSHQPAQIEPPITTAPTHPQQQPYIADAQNETTTTPILNPTSTHSPAQTHNSNQLAQKLQEMDSPPFCTLIKTTSDTLLGRKRVPQGKKMLPNAYLMHCTLHVRWACEHSSPPRSSPAGEWEVVRYVSKS